MLWFIISSNLAIQLCSCFIYNDWNLIDLSKKNSTFAACGLGFWKKFVFKHIFLMFIFWSLYDNILFCICFFACVWMKMHINIYILCISWRTLSVLSLLVINVVIRRRLSSSSSRLLSLFSFVVVCFIVVVVVIASFLSYWVSLLLLFWRRVLPKSI